MGPQDSDIFAAPRDKQTANLATAESLTNQNFTAADKITGLNQVAANREVESLGFPKVESELVREIHKVEDHYVFDHNNSTPFGEQRRASLQHIWRGTQAFADKNPDQVGRLVSDLQKQDLLPQLAIAALDQALANKERAGKPIYSLTKEEAISLVGRQDALGAAIKQHLNQAFSVQAGEGFGSGYADTSITSDSGSHRMSAPAISQHHLDGLMRDFSHPPDYLSTEAQEAKDRQPAGLLSKIFSWR